MDIELMLDIERRIYECRKNHHEWIDFVPNGLDKPNENNNYSKANYAQEMKNKANGNNDGIVIKNMSIITYEGVSSCREIDGPIFFQEDAKYIGIRLFFNAVTVQKSYKLLWRIYKESGEPFTDEIICEGMLMSGNTNLLNGWGWKSAGNWPIGNYKIIASLNNGPSYESYFEIRHGSYDKLPHGITNVKLFNSTLTPPDIKSRIFTNTFYQSKSMYIFFHISFPIPNKTLFTTIDYTIRKSNNEILANKSIPITLQTNYDTCWTGYGWESPGNWDIGQYYYEVSIGGSKPITGTFQIL